MMTINLELIENKMAAMMTAESDLDSLDRIYLGVPYASLGEHDRWAVLSVDTQQGDTQNTGGYAYPLYVGSIIINVRQQDELLAVSDRVVRVSSYAAMHALANTTLSLFRTPTGRTLQNLALTNGGVLRISIGEEVVEFGINAEQERIDAFSNSAIIPFVVETQEVHTA